MTVKEKIEPLTIVFTDDGLVPNNRLPFLIYKHAVDVVKAEPERAIEELFGSNRWGGMWRNGIFDYLHYHSTAHEALGIAQGHARVRFGGDRGKEIEVSAGDVVVLPAGTGHQRILASRDFSVVGAYPPGQTMEITRPTPENREKALKTIPQVAVPDADPVMGSDGPLVRLWRRAGSHRQ
ncbi:MAG: cupin domain-containing protein [Gemmatimonas sp.]